MFLAQEVGTFHSLCPLCPSHPSPAQGFRGDPFQPLPAGRLETIPCSSSQTWLTV